MLRRQESQQGQGMARVWHLADILDGTVRDKDGAK